MAGGIRASGRCKHLNCACSFPVAKDFSDNAAHHQQDLKFSRSEPIVGILAYHAVQQTLQN